jgi:7-cyano-7-deazaguanine tRNA-ribosyltransferase
MTFEIKDRDAAGRLCIFKTNHGNVTTPTLLPVINPNKMIITPKEMAHLFGTEMVITNSYIIKRDETLQEQALQKGVHKLIDFDGPIMTDSGTFQSYVYGEIDLDPLEIIQFQQAIGSDVGTILDIFSTPDQTKKEAKQAVEQTIQRAKRSIPLADDMLVACPVQGSIYPDLRKYCAQQLGLLNPGFFPIGGVVPLMENQRYTDLVKIILASKQGLPPSKPVHLFGAGHPLIFPLAVALGCDLFDSSAYIKYAQDKRLIFPWGTEKLDDLSELPCTCPICSQTTATELKQNTAKETIKQLALHNLYISFAEMKKIRNAIAQGSLWELVEKRAHANPYLLEALHELTKKEHKKWLEQFEPTSKSHAIFYTGSHTMHRPLIWRYHNRLTTHYKLTYPTTLILPETKKPYSRYYAPQIQKIMKHLPSNIIVNSHLGPVPIELDEMYPLAQSIFPDTLETATQRLVKNKLHSLIKETHVVTLSQIKTKKLTQSNKKHVNLDLQRIAAVINMQFGNNASTILLNDNIKIIKSKKTDKIRNIYNNDKHILSMRASDGLFTLKLDGAKLLHQQLPIPKLRVIIHDDAVPFVTDGKSVFAKFIRDCDPNLRPYDECIIVDKNDAFIAVGRTLLNQSEMLSFTTGMAVKTRESIKLRAQEET